jgi:hypothetical protein
MHVSIATILFNKINRLMGVKQYLTEKLGILPPFRLGLELNTPSTDLSTDHGQHRG